MSGLNVRHALNDYGVKDNKLHVEVLAQTNTTGGGGTDSGSGSGTGNDSIPDYDPFTGAGLYTQAHCAQYVQGYWNMALISQSAGVTAGVKCTVEGELSVLGFDLIKGSFSKGKSYNVGWENMSCTSSTGNCCNASNQGLRIKNITF